MTGVKGTYQRYGKRACDIALSLALLIALALPMLLIAVIIALDSRGGVLFKQVRLGRDRRAFEIYKFRTMRADAPSRIASREMVHSGQYITRVGKYLRMSSADELPQLMNILKGDMSFVGFRPCIPEETELDALRVKSGAYRAKPGLTGLAQVRGRDLLDTPQKALLDGVYAHNLSFEYDFTIIKRSVQAVLRMDDYAEGEEL